MENEIWRTEVGHLIKVFRNSLLDLIPHLEAVRVPWREEEAYDEWDNITTVLFENIVLRSIRWGIDDANGDIALPAYGQIHRDYSERALIEVFYGEPQERPKWVFLCLSSKEIPLDTVKCLGLAKDGEVLINVSRSIPFAEALYRVWIREDGRLKGPITNLEIEV